MKNYPRELEIETVEAWLRTGAIQLTDTGSENSYYVSEFDQEFYCKNYPETYNPDCYPLRPW